MIGSNPIHLMVLTLSRRRECKQLKKIIFFYVFSLFEGNTLSTKNYDLSMESVNKNTSFESNIFQKYLCKEILEIVCFVFIYIHSSNNVCYGKNVGTNTSWEKEKHLSKSSVHFTVSIYPVKLTYQWSIQN